MADVIITPNSGLVDFQSSSTSQAQIQLDGSNNLNITNSGGNLTVGDGSSDVYLGNGITTVDLIFQNSGEIRGTGSQTITLGTSGDTIKIGDGVSFESGEYLSILQAQFSMSGGGDIIWTGSYLKWTQRVICIPVNKNGGFSISGYFDINCPTSGTITYYNSSNVTTTVTCTTNGIPLASWEGLWYKIPVGSANSSIQANFVVANYQNSTWRPTSEWVLIATRNGDSTSQSVRWLPGQINFPASGSNTWYSDLGYGTWAGGTSGSSGSSGSSGNNGNNGTSGSSGSSGNNGNNGTSGSSGSSGNNGNNGTSGSSGNSGTSGLLSLTGSTTDGVITYDGSGNNASVESVITVKSGDLCVGSVAATNSIPASFAMEVAGSALPARFYSTAYATTLQVGNTTYALSATTLNLTTRNTAVATSTGKIIMRGYYDYYDALEVVSPSGSPIILSAGTGVGVNRTPHSSLDLDVDSKALFRDHVGYGKAAQSKSGTSALTIDGNNGTYHVISMASGAVLSSITWSNIIAGSALFCATTFVIILKYSGSATVTWTNVKWSSGVNPVLTAANGKADMFTFTSYDGGSNWIGTVAATSLDSTNL